MAWRFNIAIENGHTSRTSTFSHSALVDFPVRYLNVYQVTIVQNSQKYLGSQKYYILYKTSIHLLYQFLTITFYILLRLIPECLIKVPGRNQRLLRTKGVTGCLDFHQRNAKWVSKPPLPLNSTLISKLSIYIYDYICI